MTRKNGSKQARRENFGVCSRCRPALLGYLDRAISEDRQLGLLAHLLISATETGLDGEMTAEVGHAVESYLSQKRAWDRTFFG